LHDGNLKPRVC